MIRDLKKTLKQDAYPLLFAQVGVFVLVCCLVTVTMGELKGGSLLLGGATYVVASVFFLKQFFSEVRVRFAERIVRNFYFAEINKFILITIISLVIWHFATIKACWFLMGILCIHMTTWLTLLIIHRKKLRAAA